MNFDGKIALVTGSTSGIGKEIAKQLLLNGCIVIINYAKNTEQAESTIKELEEYKNNIILLKADISSKTEVKKMFSEIKEKFGKLDFLVNNSGINIDSFIEDFDVEDFRKVIDVNLIGKFICTKYAIPLLKKSKVASIVNISSRLGIKPCEESSPYCAAAAGIINLTKTSALELSKYGIRVNSICPGFTPTPLSMDSWSEEEIEQKKKTNPLGRLATTTDTANAVLFFLSDNASYITGENISINGGSSLK